MFSLFGTKLFNGPMWRVEGTSQDSASQMMKEKLTVNVTIQQDYTVAYHVYRLGQMYLGYPNVLYRDELQAVVF